MTTIHVNSEDGPEEFGYVSDIFPRIGETISLMDVGTGKTKVLKVLKVDHLIKINYNGQARFELLTITVERMKS